VKKMVKRRLLMAFDAPPPVHRRAFLRCAPAAARGGWGTFLLSQLGCIRKRVWCLDAAVLMLVLLGGGVLEAKMLGLLSALMPLLATAAIAESGRSKRFCMAELEQAARFSLKSVALARLSLMGAANGVLFGILTAAGSWYLGSSWLYVGVYALCPYMMTALLALWISRRFRGRDGDFLYVGIGVIFSAGALFAADTAPWLYAGRYFDRWVVAAAVLTACVLRENKQFIQKMEDSIWN